VAWHKGGASQSLGGFVWVKKDIAREALERRGVKKEFKRSCRGLSSESRGELSNQ